MLGQSTWGFRNLPAWVSTWDGRNFVFLDDLLYNSKAGVQLRIPSGAETDGASTPRGSWNALPPFGTYWPAAALHDAAYRNTLQILNSQGSWVVAALDKVTCDSLLREAMEWLQVPSGDIFAIFEGVHEFGQASFDEDRRPAQ